MTTVPSQAPTTQLTSWTPPTWTTSVSTDGDLIESSCLVASLGPSPHRSEEAFTVMLMQRDEIRPSPSRLDVVRHPASALVGGVSFNESEVERLGELLTRAAGLMREGGR